LSWAKTNYATRTAVSMDQIPETYLEKSSSSPTARVLRSCSYYHDGGCMCKERPHNSIPLLPNAILSLVVDVPKRTLTDPRSDFDGLTRDSIIPNFDSSCNQVFYLLFESRNGHSIGPVYQVRCHGCSAFFPASKVAYGMQPNDLICLEHSTTCAFRCVGIRCCRLANIADKTFQAEGTVTGSSKKYVSS